METQEILQGIHDWTNGKIVYDISVAHPDGQGNPTKYATLAAALGANGANIPEAMRKGGMSVKFVHSSDNKYVQYRYMGTDVTTAATFTNVANWQGVDTEPISGSHNLVESGGVKSYVDNEVGPLQQKVAQITTEEVLTESEEVAFTSNDDLEEYAKINHQGVSAKALKYKDGDEYVDVKEKIDSIGIETEQAHDNTEEQSWESDDGNEKFASVGRYGIKAKAFLDLNGNPIVPTIDNPCSITDDIYVVVGRELCLYADAVINSQDRGLESPINYRVVFNCNVGEVHDRLYHIVPTSEQAGDYTFRTRVFNMNNEVVIDKTSTLHIINSDGLNSAKNILFVGDSLGKDTAKWLKSHFAEMQGTQPNFVGSVALDGGGYCEAYGGWRYADYDSVGRPAYRCQVSNITTIARGAVYTDGTHNFTVQETNISDGSGNISLSFVSGVTTLPATLSKVSGVGDSTITIDSYAIEGNNKFWNLSTNQLDIAGYRQQIGLSGNIDVVVFALGINDAGYGMPVATVKSNIEHLYAAFIADNPNCKVVISIVPTWGNTISGTRTNGGAAYDVEAPKPFYWGYVKMFLEHFVDNADYSNIRVAPVGQQVDRFYGYARTDYTISKYISEKTTEHNNYAHPSDVGYKQYAEGFLSELIALFE